MKKIIISTVLFLMMLSVPVVAGTYSRSSKSNGTCAVKGCNNAASGKSIYCSRHKCTMSGCISMRMGDKYCAYHNNKNNRKSSSGGSYNSGSRKSSIGSSTRKSSVGSSTRKKSSGSGRTCFDPDDHDIEAYYDDNRDEYDDYDDAYDGFLDDDSAWDDY